MKILTGDGELVTRHVCARSGLAVDRVRARRGDRPDDRRRARARGRAQRPSSPASRPRRRAGSSSRSSAGATSSATSATASTTRPRCTPPTSASPSRRRVDVARDAADIILLERGLRVLHGGIIEGRRAFGNVMKYLLMGTSSNFGNMLSMAAATVLLPFLPMLPHADPAQQPALRPRADHHPDRQRRRGVRPEAAALGHPHHPALHALRRPDQLALRFPRRSSCCSASSTRRGAFHTGWFVESLATQTLVIFVIRTDGQPARASRPSAPLAATTLGVAASALLLPFTPLARALGFVPLPARRSTGFLAGDRDVPRARRDREAPRAAEGRHPPRLARVRAAGATPPCARAHLPHASGRPAHRLRAGHALIAFTSHQRPKPLRSALATPLLARAAWRPPSSESSYPTTSTKSPARARLRD